MLFQDLLAPDGFSWDEQSLEHNFLSADARAIIKIPLGKLQEDTWAWSPERHGLYTVRSAYSLLASHSRLEETLQK